MKKTRTQKKELGRLEQERTAELRSHSDDDIPIPSDDKRGIFRTILDGLDSLWNTGNRNNFFPW